MNQVTQCSLVCSLSLSLLNKYRTLNGGDDDEIMDSIRHSKVRSRETCEII